MASLAELSQSANNGCVFVLPDPASELQLPRHEKWLPAGALTAPLVEALLAVPDVTDPLGVRDRAMLEVFYSTGLRRFELCGLDLVDFNPERQTLTVRRGEGHKDRVVPIGARAIAWEERYLKGSARGSAWTRGKWRSS